MIDVEDIVTHSSGFFGVRIVDDGGTLSHVQLIPIDNPNDVMATIRALINEDIITGQGYRLEMLLLSARSAAILFHRDVIKQEHLENATHGHDALLESDFMHIPDVMIDGRVLTVRVLEYADHEVATADSEGNIIGLTFDDD